MNMMTSHRGRIGVLIAGSAMILSNMSPAWADQKLMLPAGTVIPVKLDQSLDSKHSQPGDRFFASVKQGRDDAGLPYGTRIEGVVREALPSGDGKPGVIDLDFRRLVLPGGQAVNMDGTLYSLNGKDVKRKDGRMVATADKGKDRLKWVGIGAGAGLLLGTVTKGNSLFDAVLGAGAGFLYNELQGKKAGDVNLKEGTDFGVRLDRQISVNVDDNTYNRFQDRVSGDLPDDRLYRRGDPNNSRYRRDSNELDRSSDPYYQDRNREDNWSSRNPANRNGDEIGMVIDNREVRFSSAKPFMRNDIVMVPLEPVSKAIDTGYRYDAGDRMIRTRNGKVRLNVGSRVAFVNGQRRVLPAPAESREGVIYVPMQFLSWFIGGSASWDSASRTVVVVTDRDRE